jgi:hypothetical protein
MFFGIKCCNKLAGKQICGPYHCIVSNITLSPVRNVVILTGFCFHISNWLEVHFYKGRYVLF